MCDPWKRVWAWLLLYWASQPDPNNCLVSCLLPHVEEPRATLSTPGLPRLCLQDLQLWTPLRPTRSGHGAAQPVAVVDISSNPPVRQVLPSPLHLHHLLAVSTCVSAVPGSQTETRYPAPTPRPRPGLTSQVPASTHAPGQATWPASVWCMGSHL